MSGITLSPAWITVLATVALGIVSLGGWIYNIGGEVQRIEGELARAERERADLWTDNQQLQSDLDELEGDIEDKLLVGLTNVRIELAKITEELRFVHDLLEREVAQPPG